MSGLGTSFMRVARCVAVVAAVGMASLASGIAVSAAAELPTRVKVGRIGQVRMCTLVGGGYYYIPGTDTCIRIGRPRRPTRMRPIIVSSGFGASGRALLGTTRAILSAVGGWDAEDGAGLASVGGGASAYAAEGLGAVAAAPDGAAVGPAIRAWFKVFGGQQREDPDQTLLGATTSFGGGVAGFDTQVRPDLRLGLLLGGAANQVAVDNAAQTIDTTFSFTGLYAHLDRAPYFAEAKIVTGLTENASRRLAAVGAGGALQYAPADYGGWFVSPELAVGLRTAAGPFVLTPKLQVRYVANVQDGYIEAGSAANLTVSRITAQFLEERGELAVSRLWVLPGGEALRTTVRIGALGLHRIGDMSVRASLGGVPGSIPIPGRADTVGGYAGAGLVLKTSARTSLFADVDGYVLSDHSHLVQGRGGLRVTF
jgi:uncharacterized protein with beta-barrel porin domain